MPETLHFNASPVGPRIDSNNWVDGVLHRDWTSLPGRAVSEYIPWRDSESDLEGRSGKERVLFVFRHTYDVGFEPLFLDFILVSKSLYLE